MNVFSVRGLVAGCSVRLSDSMSGFRFNVVLFSFFSGDGHWIQQCDMESLILSLEGGGQVPKPVRQLFTRSSTVSGFHCC